MRKFLLYRVSGEITKGIGVFITNFSAFLNSTIDAEKFMPTFDGIHYYPQSQGKNIFDVVTIVTAVALGVIIFIVTAFFGFKIWYQKSKNERRETNKVENKNQELEPSPVAEQEAIVLSR